MKLIDRYIINRFTIALMGVYLKNGYFYSLVMEGKKTFLVNLSPTEILETSLLYYGNDLEGAENASKAALGDIEMPPIKISGSLGIYWFPSTSTENADCVWFSVNHIKEIIAVGKSKSKVVLEFGDAITVNIRKKAFEMKEYRARYLKNIYDKRTDPRIKFTYNPRKKADNVAENKNTYHFEQTEDGIIQIFPDKDNDDQHHKK
ncbi:competence protein ComK [Lederbergia panacisoli]|uniref:competence protein ComK n=1 Tax=Lederbergia panacisoli TaxID=1255251 RepID=UPI00214BB876|nr:competence protein ComK [Lederbergia panacisoli]MCR2822975.1 competence protein ComK [Lederbergia panacisoli]